MSTLGDELERARAYLEILKIRMGERLNAADPVPDALKGVPMPAMMLPDARGERDKARAGTGDGRWHDLDPGARARTERLRLRLADDGRGFQRGGGGPGIGLRTCASG